MSGSSIKTDRGHLGVNLGSTCTAPTSVWPLPPGTPQHFLGVPATLFGCLALPRALRNTFLVMLQHLLGVSATLFGCLDLPRAPPRRHSAPAARRAAAAPCCSAAGCTCKQNLKAVCRVLVSSAESKRGVNCENPGSTWGQPSPPHHALRRCQPTLRIRRRHGVVAQVAVKSKASRF